MPQLAWRTTLVQVGAPLCRAQWVAAEGLQLEQCLQITAGTQHGRHCECGRMVEAAGGMPWT
jgi:hypothetical protein